MEYIFLPLKKAAQELGVHWAWLRDRRLKGDFIESVHYAKISGFRSICYNVPLIRHFLACGGDRVAHQWAIDDFLAWKRGRLHNKGSLAKKN